jgi:phosphocarrier protein
MEGTRIVVSKDGHEAGGTSILGLMMLGAAKGDTVTVRVEGEQAEARLAELVALVEAGFGED